MASITLKGNTISTIGELPAVGSKAVDFLLTKTDLSDVKLSDFSGKRVVLNIFPSVDTGVCAASVRKFNAEASSLDNAVVLCISKDLPFAHRRFCEVEGLNNVIPASELRDSSFSNNYGVLIANGPMAGLMSRAIVIVDEEGKVSYTEQVPEITQEPDYSKAMEAIN